MTNHQRTDAYPEAETNRQQEVDHHQSRRIDFKRPSPEGNPKKYQNKNGTVNPCLEQSRSQKCIKRTNSSIKKQLLPLRHPSQRLNSDLAKQIQQCDPAGEPDHWIQQICRSRPNQNPQCQKCENQGHGLNKTPQTPNAPFSARSSNSVSANARMILICNIRRSNHPRTRPNPGNAELFSSP